MIIVADPAAGNRQLAIRYARAVEEVELLVIEIEAAQEPLGKYMLVGAGVGVEPKAAKKACAERKVVSLERIEQIARAGFPAR
jgi:hypothetical protein